MHKRDIFTNSKMSFPTFGMFIITIGTSWIDTFTHFLMQNANDISLYFMKKVLK